jgi:hypothetical protein
MAITAMTTRIVNPRIFRLVARIGGQIVLVILVATLILITTALIHIGKPASMATTTFIFSTAVAARLVLLMDNDRPFAAGGITITPAAFREIVLN